MTRCAGPALPSAPAGRAGAPAATGAGGPWERPGQAPLPRRGTVPHGRRPSPSDTSAVRAEGPGSSRPAALPLRTAPPRGLRGRAPASPAGALPPGLLGRVVPARPDAFAPTTCPVRPPNGRRGRQRRKTRAKAVGNCSFVRRSERRQLHFPSLPGRRARRHRARRDGHRSSGAVPRPIPRHESPGSPKLPKWRGGRWRGGGAGARRGRTALAPGRWSTRGIAGASAESVLPPASPSPRTLADASGPQGLVGQPQNGGERERQREQQRLGSRLLGSGGHRAGQRRRPGVRPAGRGGRGPAGAARGGLQPAAERQRQALRAQRPRRRVRAVLPAGGPGARPAATLASARPAAAAAPR